MLSDKTGRLNQMTSATPSHINLGPFSPYNSGLPSTSTKIQAFEQVNEEGGVNSFKGQAIMLDDMPDFADK